jgi:uncharacterized UPF0160 family protein
MVNLGRIPWAPTKTNIPNRQIKIKSQKEPSRVGAPKVFYIFVLFDYSPYRVLIGYNRLMIQSIATHNGRFHSDDVFSVAMLKMLFPDAKVVRSRDLDLLAGCDLVLDVGGVYDVDKLRFDHHMTGGAGQRPNGIKYSAFGLIWQQYGLEFCDGNEEVWKRLNEGFVSSFDAYDNGQKTFEITTEDAKVVQLQDIFDAYLNPNMDEPCELPDYDRQFGVATEIATLILERVRARKIAEVKSEQYFFEQWQASPDKRYVVLDKFATSGEKAEDMRELLYYVYLAPNGTWNIKALARDKGTYELKKPLPESWAGLRDTEFAEHTGVIDAAFCHDARFMCGAYSKEGALKLLEIALQ